MNPTSFDVSLVSWLNRFEGRVPWFDSLLVGLAENQLLKGGILMAVVWWLWLRPKGDPAERRERVLAAIAGSMAAAAASRLLTLVLPFRARPALSQDIVFNAPYTTLQKYVNDNSFPSDHAAAGFGLCAGILFISPPLGIAAIAYVFAVVCVPRMYLGYHWPTDVVAGAALGLLVGSVMMKARIARVKLARPAQWWLERSPHTFYASLFLLTFQLATNFNDVRNLGHSAVAIARALVH